jgi:hypothetical protein
MGTKNHEQLLATTFIITCEFCTRHCLLLVLKAIGVFTSQLKVNFQSQEVTSGKRGSSTSFQGL